MFNTHSDIDVSTPFPGPACISFAYHMHGSGLGSLELVRNRGGYKEKLWHRSGDQRDYWHRASIDTSLFWLDMVSNKLLTQLPNGKEY